MLLINLVCVKVKSKLRVRIVSSGYKQESNCQFPRNLRVEGRKFTAPASDISLIKRGASYFYSVKAINVKIVETANLKVFGENESDCVVCLCEPSNVVFGPCGHLSCCKDCSIKLSKCPMCRAKINIVIDYNELK